MSRGRWSRWPGVGDGGCAAVRPSAATGDCPGPRGRKSGVGSRRARRRPGSRGARGTRRAPLEPARRRAHDRARRAPRRAGDGDFRSRDRARRGTRDRRWRPRRRATRSGRGGRLPGDGRVSLLDVRGLVVAHGALEVLHDVTLAVSEGEIVTVIGPNGAGKTTLMRTLAGVLAPVRGDVVFAGRSIAGEPAHRVVRRGLALVPEGRRVFADQSVRANLELGAVSHGRRADVAAVLDRFPALRERLDAP